MLEQGGVQIQSPYWKLCEWRQSSYFSRVFLGVTVLAASLLSGSAVRFSGPGPTLSQASLHHAHLAVQL